MPLNFNEEFKKENFGALDAGTYEVYIAKVEKQTASTSGRDMLKVTFRIRNDVEQPFKGRIVSEYWFLDNNPDYAKEGWYDTIKTYRVLHTQPEPKTDFKTPDELLSHLPKLCMKITLEKVFNETTGNDENRIKKNSYAASEAPALVEDDDLPF